MNGPNVNGRGEFQDLKTQHEIDDETYRDPRFNAVGWFLLMLSFALAFWSMIWFALRFF